MSATRKYHSLLIRHRDGGRHVPSGQWGVAFGSLVRAEVEEERRDALDHGVAMRDTKIVTTDEDQASIDAVVSGLNASVSSREPAR